MEMKIVFLDANVLWSAASNPHRSHWHPITAKPRKADFITSHYALAEARRNLASKDLPELDRIVARLRLVPDAFGPPPAGVILPGKDVPILASAAAAGADVLVTGDEHFGQYFGRTLGGVKIVLPRNMADEL